MKRIWIFPLFLIFTGCAGVVTEQDGTAPVEERGSQASIQTPGRIVIPQEKASAASGLIRQAQDYEQQGQLAKAAAVFERALRISSRDGVIWYQLAQVRMKQGQYSQAESLARKSLSLAGRDPALQLKNWELIAEARRLRGDLGGEKKARLQIEQLSQINK